MWDLIVSVPDHCLSFYFKYTELSVLMIYIIFPCKSLAHAQ